MEFVNPGVKREYEWWRKQVKRSCPEDISVECKQCISVYDVLRAHFLIVDYFLHNNEEGVGGMGPDLNRLCSTVARQHVGFGGFIKWRNIWEKSAALFYGIIKNHPFPDTNKRTAFLSLIYQLYKNKYIPKASQKEFEKLSLRVAANELEKYPKFQKMSKNKGKKLSYSDIVVYFIADFLKRKTRKMSKNHYILTYRELNKILKNLNVKKHQSEHRFFLDNPENNHITIYEEIVEHSYILFWKKDRREIISRMRIPFTDWGKEVSKKLVSQIRKKLNLDTAHGYDSKVFYQGMDPLPTLIPRYSDLLERLADE